MSDGFNFNSLKTEILKLSKSTMWDAAKLEWQLESVFDADEQATCLCTHFPIREICVLRNSQNQNTAEVGNVCVKRFLGIRSDKVFDCLRRIGKDSTKALNAETIELFYQQNLISDWERIFSFDTMKQRKLTPKQIISRNKIAAKILAQSRRLKPPPS